MAAVATEAGLSVGGIYRRFENKRALLLGLHDWLISRLEARIATVLTEELPSLAAVVDALIGLLISLYSSNERLYGAIFTRGNDPVQSERARRAIQNSFKHFRTASLTHASEIAHPHDEVDAALATAFHIIYAATIMRIGRDGTDLHPLPFGLLSWPVLQVQLRQASIGFLKTRPAV